MASRAFALWQTESSARLDELERFHAAAGGSGTGQQSGVEQLNRSMFVALVAQFQTYCRNVHDDAIDVHADEANPRQVEVLRLLLTQGRKLDAGNPRSGALGSDFDRLGFQLIPALRAEGGTVPATLADLDVLVDFRNAVSTATRARWRTSSPADRSRPRSSAIDISENASPRWLLPWIGW